MRRRLATSCVYRGAPIQVEGDRDTWSATVWLPDGGTVRSSGHQRYADAMGAARRIADEALLERAYRAAQGQSRWERRERNANRLRAAWALVLTAFIVWALFGPPTEPRRAELRERWETNQ